MKLQKIKETGGLHTDNRVRPMDEANALNLGDVTDFATVDPI